jgi:DNA sulfur modification protein DndB
MTSKTEIIEGPNFFGDLIRNEALEQIAKQRVKKYHELKIHKMRKEKYLNKGWTIRREYKNSLAIQKDKKIDELLEDEVWLLFKNMGYLEMNKDRNFKIQAGPVKQQIDVFAKDDINVFVIFCTSQEKQGPAPSIRTKIRAISDLKRDITMSVKNYYKKKMRVLFLFITKNIIWNPKDEELASQNQIFYWKESDVEAYSNLTEQLGNGAKYQMFSLLFQGKKAFEIGEIEVPAMRGGRGRKKYYCFVIQPEKLFPIAYVHRRERSNPRDVGNTYQRMVKRVRLDKIADFVNKGGFFPNNVILSFTKKPQFKEFGKKGEFGDIAFGVLKFPPYYGCAWIIDGQHRIYGYSKSEKALDSTIPVVAFESLGVKDQANLFVEINKEQEKVNRNLLWDLYPDIYYDSEDEKHQQLRIISLVAKELNLDENSIFYNHIQIPSLIIKDKKVTNLTLTNICDAIKENKLINKDENLLYNKDYENTVDFAAERIKVFFEVVSDSLERDWEKGDKGLLRTNVGIRIFFIIFRQLLRYLNYQEGGRSYKKVDLRKFETQIKEILDPVLTK